MNGKNVEDEGQTNCGANIIEPVCCEILVFTLKQRNKSKEFERIFLISKAS